jgi:4-hydroxy-tetrahydrodipicolinate reductase
MVNIVISGFRGRMGNSLFKLAQKMDDVRIVGAVVRPNHPEIGTEVCDSVVLQGNVSPLLNEDTVLIEFSTPLATIQHLEQAVKANAKMVIGTTGLTDEQEDYVKSSSKIIPILESHNFGIGMNTFWELIRTATKILGNSYDVEIIEFHGGKKPDVPSGTGLIIGKIIAEAKGVEFDDVVRYGRDYTKTNVRRENEICFHSLRAGSFRSDHTVIFAGNGERLEFTHREESPDIISHGALLGAKFLNTRKPGYYSMTDVLDFLQQK